MKRRNWLSSIWPKGYVIRITSLNLSHHSLRSSSLQTSLLTSSSIRWKAQQSRYSKNWRFCVSALRPTWVATRTALSRKIITRLQLKRRDTWRLRLLLLRRPNQFPNTAHRKIFASLRLCLTRRAVSQSSCFKQTKREDYRCSIIARVTLTSIQQQAIAQSRPKKPRQAIDWASMHRAAPSLASQVQLQVQSQV